MALLTNSRPKGAARAFHQTNNNYTPELIGSWVAVDKRDMPWNTIGAALAGSSGTGETVDHNLTAEEALRITGLDFDVKKAPVKDADTGLIIPRMFTTYRDMPEVEGGRYYYAAVSDKYNPVPPRQTLSFFDEVLANHNGAHYTAAWDMKEKAMIGATIEFPETIVVDPNGAADELGLYGLGVGSFDGSTSIQMATTAVRFFCMNQLPPSFKIGGKKIRRSIGFKHTSGIMSRGPEARAALGVALNWAAGFDKIANDLFAKSMSDRQFERLVSSLPEFSLDGSETDLKKARVIGRRDELAAAWRAPHNANITGTRWGAYNVLTEYMDWGRTVHGSKRTGTDPVRQRAIGTMVNATVSGFKGRVWDRVNEMK